MKTKYKKNNLVSRLVSKGPERAPHRSYYYAMGLKEKEINRPFVGVVSTWNEAAPCNISLMGQTKFVKKGVTEAGGTPREFTTITVTDGIAMGHPGMKSSLVSREVIADSVELTVRGHCYDAIVGVAGCDKSLPGLMMVMARLNLPSIFMYGGSILPGKFRGKQVTVQDLFEAVGEYASGKIKKSDLYALEKVACPSAGSCGGQFTANTMACVAEAIGLALPGTSAIPATFKEREKTAKLTGKSIMQLIKNGPKPRDIITKKSLENATRIVAASGGSTNAALHLPAIAHEAGINFDLFDVMKVFKTTPYIASMKPSGKYVAKDLYDVGGVPILMKALLDGGLLHKNCITVTGKTIAQNLKGIRFPKNQDVVLETKNPISKNSGVVVLKGSLASQGAVVKIAGMKNLEFIGKKTHTVPVDSIGNVLNYSLRQIAGEDKYKHGFLINYPKINTENKTFSNISVDSLESFVNNLNDSTIKTLTQTQSEIDRKIPVIVRILDLDNIKRMLEYLSTYSNNSSLDKFVYKKFNDGTNESAIYYIAVHDQVDNSTKN